MRPSRAGRRLPVVVLAAVLAAGCTGQTHVLDPTPDTFRAPLKTSVIDPEVLAAPGNAIWADFHGLGPGGITGNQVSLDGGRTWQAGIRYPEHGHVVASAGRIAFYGGDDRMAMPMTFAAGDPETLQTLQWEDDGRKLQAMGTAAVVWTNGLLSTRGATIPTRWPKLQRGHSDYVFSADSVWLARIVHGAAVDQLSVAPVSSGVGRAPVELPRALSYAADQNGLRSLINDAQGLSVCSMTLPSAARSCVPVTGPTTTASLHQAGAISVVKADGKGYVIEAGWVTAIQLPDQTRDWDAEGAGDPVRPLIRVIDSVGEPRHYRLDPDGSLVAATFRARNHLVLDVLALTPTTVFGTSAGSSWRRDIGAQGVGGEIGLSGAVSAASAGRVLVDRGSGVQCLDDTQLGPVIATGADQLSGPYVLAGGAVLTVAGRSSRASRPQAVFGSLVVEDPALPGAGNRVQIRDLTGSSAPVQVELSPAGAELATARLWGDWVGATFASTTADGTRTAELRNWRTGAARATAGELVGLGDGFAVVLRPGADEVNSLVAVDLVSGVEAVLTRGTASTVLAVDGARVAFVDGTDLVVRTVNGAGTSAPRLLGALTTGDASPRSVWRIALDLTKPVGAGTLAIRSPNGSVVRTLPSPGSTSGSVRGLSWDGRDDAGARVASGTYGWEYRAEAADGTGAVRDVTGLSAAGGSIRVR